MTTTYHVEPQRSPGRGWVSCEVHQATRWAVVECTVHSAPGITNTHRKILSKYPRPDLAHKELEIVLRKASHRPRPTLGQRFIRTGRKIIAGSRS